MLERFNRRKRSVTGKWHVDETYIKVRSQWMYLYRAIDSVRDTVEFWFSEQRDLLSAKQFFRKALARHDRPDRVVIDGNQTNHEAIILSGIEMVHMMRKRQGRYAFNPNPLLAEQFTILAA